ncbi:MAG: isocitrate lyase/phosphoenolpyruvate mutase family protein [Bdellovibrionales bacterium]|jgi:phosphoenolpyruvate phosphomutase
MEKITLHALLSKQNKTPILGCHDALSAIIGEKAGFKALWASSLGLSTVQGRRDAGELSWSETVEMASNITASTNALLLVDGDNGHGDFNIARLFAKKLSKAGAAGISIEDQAFPKRNSLMAGNQELEEMESFCGKIAAIKDSVDANFTVVARVEALIVGAGIAVASERAHAYVEAGADAIIIHSKSSDASDIVSFVRAWDQPTPIILIPTTYHKSLAPQLAGLKVGGVVWANQMLRAQVSTLQFVAKELLANQNPDVLEPTASVKDIFSLVGLDNLPREELKYKKAPAKMDRAP